MGQAFVVGWILIFAERMKLFARDVSRERQSFCPNTDPLAGTNLPGGVVIILRQMLVEILLGSRQMFLDFGREHNI